MPTKPALAVLYYVIRTKECWSVSKELIDGFGNCRFSVRDENDIGHGIDFWKDVFQMAKEEGMSSRQFPLMDQAHGAACVCESSRLHTRWPHVGRV